MPLRTYQLPKVLGQHARGGIALDVHALQPPAVDEVVDVGGAPRTLNRVVDVGQGEPLRTRLLAIDRDPVLRVVVEPVGAHAGEERILRRQGEQLVARLHEGLVAEAGLVDELEVEARRVAELERRRRREAEDHRFLRAGKVPVEARGDLLHAIALAGDARPMA